MEKCKRCYWTHKGPTCADGKPVMSEAKQLLAELVKKLRSRATWSRDGYYTTELEGAVNTAVRETLEGIAQDIEELIL